MDPANGYITRLTNISCLNDLKVVLVWHQRHFSWPRFAGLDIAMTFKRQAYCSEKASPKRISPYRKHANAKTEKIIAARH